MIYFYLNFHIKYFLLKQVHDFMLSSQFSPSQCSHSHLPSSQRPSSRTLPFSALIFTRKYFTPFFTPCQTNSFTHGNGLSVHLCGCVVIMFLFGSWLISAALIIKKQIYLWLINH